MTARGHTTGAAGKVRRPRRMRLPGWVPAALLVLSVVLLAVLLAVVVGGVIVGWRWLDGRGWLPVPAQLVVSGFAAGVVARMVKGWRTGWALDRSSWGSWRRRLRALS